MRYNIGMKKMSEYMFHIGLQMRAYPSYRQKSIIRMNGGASRFVYNRLVAVHNEMFQLKKSAAVSSTDAGRLSFLQASYQDARAIKNAAPFLWDCDSDMVLHTIANYQRAWKQFKNVKGTRIPTFHKFDNTYCYQTSNHYAGKKLDAVSHVIGLYEGSVRFKDKNHIVLPMLGTIRVKGSPKLVSALLDRTCETRIGTVSIRLDACGDCYISLALASDEPFHYAYAQTGTAVGIDMNLANFFTDSDGVAVDPPHWLKKAEGRLCKAQRALSRKYEAAKHDGRDYRTCRNYQEARIRLAECHRHVTNQRLNFIRCMADKEVKSHDYLFAEDLKVRNLKKNHTLAKAISDSGWRTFLTELQNTASKRGKTCLLVDPKHTTQTCSTCGHVMSNDSKIVLGQEEWTCPICGTHHVRDYNAAVNIKNAGLSLLKESGMAIDIR